MTAHPKPPTCKDPGYLLSLRGERCIITGFIADDRCSVVAHHVGHDKRRDDHAIPVSAVAHKRLHDTGEASFYRRLLPDRVLIDAMRALAEKMYWEAKS